MNQLEKVEKIREKTGVTYEEARAALEAADGDVLDALVYLESKGKIKEPEIPVFTTRTESSQEFKKASRTYDESGKETFGDQMKKLVKWIGTLIRKGCENYFIVNRHGEELIVMPVLVLVLLLFFAFWITLPLMVAGLFFGFKYSFKGQIAQAVDVNTACEKAAEAAENIKQEFTK